MTLPHSTTLALVAALSVANLATAGRPSPGIGCVAPPGDTVAIGSSGLRTVNDGEPLLTTTDLPGKRWPRVCVYQFIAASPEAALAVLVDYPLRPSYLPDVRESVVVPPVRDSASRRVAYLIHVFAGVNESDTLHEVVRTIGRAGSGKVQLEWTGLASSMAQSIDGSATFIPWRNADTGAIGTLMIYDQTVQPGSRLAGLPFIRNRGVAAVRRTAAAIAQQVEREVGQQPRLLERQVSELRRRLAVGP